MLGIIDDVRRSGSNLDTAPSRQTQRRCVAIEPGITGHAAGHQQSRVAALFGSGKLNFCDFSIGTDNDDYARKRT